MAPDSLALKQSMAAAEADPQVDTGPAAVALMQQWLARHEGEIIKRRLESPSEFNGTMIQWFHWYGEADGGQVRIFVRSAISSGTEIQVAGFCLRVRMK